MQVWVKISVVSVLIVFADLTAAISQYLIFTGKYDLQYNIALAVLTLMLIFLIRPLLDTIYNKSVKVIYTERVVNERVKYFDNLSSNINNLYYKEDYLDSIHLQNTAIDKLSQFTTSSFELFRLALHALAYLLIFLHFVPQYFLLLLFFGGLAFLFRHYHERKQVDYFITNVPEDRTAKYYREVVFDPRSMHDIKISGFEEEVANKSIRSFLLGLDKRYKLRRENAIISPLLKSFSAFIIAVALFIVINQPGLGLAGSMVVVSALLVMLSEIDPLSKAFFNYKEAKVIIDRAKQSNLVLEKYQSKGIILDKIKEIRFDNVSFSYNESQDILKGISFTWNTNKSISLLGENGGGKTSLIKLILGINKPSSGQIYINGIPLPEINFDSYVSRIGIVLQEYVIFEDTIQNNVFFGNEVKINDEVKSLVNTLLSFVGEIPKGIEADIGQITSDSRKKLSKGQEQRLAIASALIKDSDIFILDEPTSSMDLTSEYEFYNFFRRLCKSKASFIVSHRIAFASIADEIIVMRDGRIVESGSHDELMKLKAEYYKMFTAQASMYN